eukprot:CAMPEP_0115060994 /NCGR_PEP_ID=MMETSP0227-20121206/7763_1 /TAXON_ID=89957 /ORGANISM="Polarella glacialis, Strain CCMP 1383" /LENGTH=201 /DNA_ID=CAMNT_0002446251 /DNA_START=553 /DNA_END=1159 /DNA_ORIENTATION=+
MTLQEPCGQVEHRDVHQRCVEQAVGRHFLGHHRQGGLHPEHGVELQVDQALDEAAVEEAEGREGACATKSSPPGLKLLDQLPAVKSVAFFSLTSHWVVRSAAAAMHADWAAVFAHGRRTPTRLRLISISLAGDAAAAAAMHADWAAVLAQGRRTPTRLRLVSISSAGEAAAAAAAVQEDAAGTGQAELAGGSCASLECGDF